MTAKASVAVELGVASSRRSRAGVLALWPVALIGVGGLATFAWVAFLAWIVLSGVLRLLGVR